MTGSTRKPRRKESETPGWKVSPPGLPGPAREPPAKSRDGDPPVTQGEFT